MIAWIRLIRIHQWLKNLFILLPLFFAGRIEEWETVLLTAISALAFCFVASSIYILNDWMDAEDDRNHPRKKSRPIASGEISPGTALGGMAVLLAAGLSLQAFINLDSFYFTLAYLAMNILYSIWIKHIPILDINVIAIGFVLRLMVGSATGDVKLSMWIILLTFLLALFLALAKRRDDVLLALEGKKVRKSIDGYNLEFINGAMIIMASVTIVAYVSYTISDEVIRRFGTEYLYTTVFFVILGIMRYMQITFVEEKSGSPTQILIRDIFLQITLIGWIISFVWIIY